MFGTLIGIFITSTAIVIGADSAISNKEGFLGELSKTCKVSSGSIAAIQGEYAIPYDSKKDTPDYLRQAFMESCERLSLSPDIIAGPLVKSGSKLPFPLINLSRPEVMAAREVNRSGDCSEFTQEQAKALYETAVCLTIEIGPAVGLRSGIVGGTLHLWTIPIEGFAKLKVIGKPSC